MRIVELNKLNKNELKRLLKRSSINYEKITPVVKDILDDIKLNGDSAVIKYNKQFDSISEKDFIISEEDINESENRISEKIKKAIDTAAANIYKYHLQQLPKDYSIEINEGINCYRKFNAIENVGLYIPGGNAVLISTMLMLGIPTAVAKNKRVVACTPGSKGVTNTAVLYAAKVCGIKEIYSIGGAQAIGMMAYGSQTIKNVNKIFGPGNQYVSCAKSLVSIDPEGAMIDMIAGPSEVLVIADENANPKFIASDLLAQAEHGVDSEVILVTTSIKLAEKVLCEIKKNKYSTADKNITEQSLENSFCLIVNNLVEAIEFSNQYAPEHLIINSNNQDEISNQVINAGSVFVGEYTPESAGDYASGTNHSLPTSGYAKSVGGVSVEMFMKSISFQKITENGLKGISDTIIDLALEEGLPGHANSVKVRLDNEN